MSKAQTRLTPGTYILKSLYPLDALREDKRRTNDWRYNPIRVGQRFFYKEWTYAPGDDETITSTEQRIYPVGDYEHLSVKPGESDRTRQLEELLVRVEDTPSLWLRREHSLYCGLQVLDVLVATGKVTLAEIQAIANKEEGTT